MIGRVGTGTGGLPLLRRSVRSRFACSVVAVGTDVVLDLLLDNAEPNAARLGVGIPRMTGKLVEVDLSRFLVSKKNGERRKNKGREKARRTRLGEDGAYKLWVPR